MKITTKNSGLGWTEITVESATTTIKEDIRNSEAENLIDSLIDACCDLSNVITHEENYGLVKYVMDSLGVDIEDLNEAIGKE